MESSESVVFVPVDKALRGYGDPPTLFQHESGLVVRYEAALTPLRGVSGFNLTIPDEGLLTRQTIKDLLAKLGLTNINSSTGEWQYENHLKDFFGPYKYASICEWYTQGLKDLIIHHAPTGVWIKSNDVVGLHEVPDLGSSSVHAQQQIVPPIPALQAIPALLNGGSSSQVESAGVGEEECMDVEMEVVVQEEIAEWVVGLRTEGGDLDMDDPMEDVQTFDVCLLEVSLASEVSAQRRMYLIVDTNVFLSNLSLIVQLNVLFRPAAEGKDPTAPELVAIVPWTVISELDKLKMKRKMHESRDGKQIPVSQLAHKAIDCLLRAQNRKDPFFRGETVVEFREAARLAQDYGLDSKNDDRILRSCLYFGKQLLQSCDGGVVMLLTNDQNLAVKAQSHGVLAKNSEKMKATWESVETVISEADALSGTLRQVLGLPQPDQTMGDFVVRQLPGPPPQNDVRMKETNQPSKKKSKPPKQALPAVKPGTPEQVNGHGEHNEDAMQVDTPSNLGYKKEKSSYFSPASAEMTAALPQYHPQQQVQGPSSQPIQGPSDQPSVVTPNAPAHQGGHLERGGHTSGRGDASLRGGGQGNGSVIHPTASPGQRSQGSSIDSPIRRGRGGRGRMPMLRGRGEPRAQLRRSRNVYQPDPCTARILGRLESSGDFPSFRHSQILSRAKQVLEIGLPGVLQYYLQQDFKTLWTDIVVVPPPWVFRDCLSVAEKHWNSVYGSYCPGPIRACLDEIVIGTKTERGGVTSATALKIIACSRDMLNAFKPPRGDVDKHLGGLEYPPISADEAGRMLYEAQQQINGIYEEFCSEVEGGPSGGYDQGYGGGGYGGYGDGYQHGYGGGRGQGWGGDRGRGRGFGRGRGGRGGGFQQSGYDGGYGGGSGQQEGFGGSNGYGAAQAEDNGNGGQGLSLPPPRTDLSWVRMATNNVQGQSKTGKEILMFIAKLQSAIQEAADRDSKAILATPGKKSGLEKVLVTMKELLDSVCWVSYELGNGEEISDETLGELIKKMQGFVSQVYTDSNRICGKTLSMPTDVFKAQLRSDLVSLYKSEDFEEMQGIWNQRYEGFVENFGISIN